MDVGCISKTRLASCRSFLWGGEFEKLGGGEEEEEEVIMIVKRTRECLLSSWIGGLKDVDEEVEAKLKKKKTTGKK